MDPVQPALVDPMGNLHHPSNVVTFAAHSRDVFRYTGDILHHFGILYLFWAVMANRSVAGVSRSTQILYFWVWSCRYLDLLDHTQTMYLCWFKISYWAFAWLTLAQFRMYESTYERKNDTCRLALIIIPCAVSAIVFSGESAICEVLWVFSQYLEGFAMVPQYILNYRHRTLHRGPGVWVICMGCYRVLYAMNWAHTKIRFPHYSDLRPWVGLIIELVFFLDFLSYRFTGNSMLRSSVLTVDSKINELSNKVTLRVLETPVSERIVEPDGGEVRKRRSSRDGHSQMEV